MNRSLRQRGAFREKALALACSAAVLFAVAGSVSATDINVYFNNTAQSGIVGPGGGSGATWNRATTFSGTGLKDVNGLTTAVGFTTTLSNVASSAGNSLTLCKYAAYSSATPTRQLVINGLTAGRQYDVYLVSYFSKGNSDKTTFSTTNTATTTSPQTADNSLGSDTATTWTAGTNYVLFQGVVPDISNNISFTIGNSGGKYLILNGFQVVEAAAAVTVPAAPTGLTATVGNQSVALAWNAVPSATGYNVMRALTAGGPYTQVGNTAGVATYSDKSVVSNTTYYYVVSATNSTGQGALSSQVSAATGVIVPMLSILPLGDSITEGAFFSPGSGGYRGPLYSLLVNAGFGVDFVGTVTGTPSSSLPDPDHEGHGGYTISGIDGLLTNVFSQVQAPDVILLLVGTNDFGTGAADAAAPDRLEQLIVRLTTQWPLARIVVSNLLVRGEPANTAIQTYFNPLLPGMVARQAALGRRVSFTDMRSSVPLSDLPDSLHPNLAGYTKMASNWFNAISALYPPGGSTTPPVITNVAASSVTSTSATLNATLSCDAACDVYAYWGTVNGGTNAALWANSAHVGSRTNVVSNAISQTVTGLTPNTTYYFAFRASPSNGPEVWAANVLYFGPSPANDILTFGLASLNNVAIGSSNITWTVPYSTNVTTLAPTYTVSPLATAAPSSGTSRDFTTPQTYTVTAQNGSTRNYLVTVAKAASSTAKDILTFGPGAVINGTTIVWTVPYGTTVTNLAPTFTLSPLATATPASGTAGNFGTPRSYTVTAEDLSTKTYQVTVTPSAAPWLNVYLNNTAQTGLVGPAGGAGATWNRNLYSGTNLSDAGGLATTVGFSTDLTNDVNGPSSLTLCKYANYASNNLATKQLVITGLTAGKQYDVYLASYFTNRDVTTFSTTNTTLTASPQSADNTLGSNSGTAWVQGTNYVLFQGVQPDTNHTMTFSINNGAGSYRILNGFQLVEVAVPREPYAGWIINYPSLTGNDALPRSDPDNDGMTNQQEFAFGLDPVSGSSCSPITAPLSAGGTFSYTRTATPATTGLVYTVWASTDLVNWGTQPVATFQVPRNPAVNGVETVDVTLTSPPTGSKFFVRVIAQ